MGDGNKLQQLERVGERPFNATLIISQSPFHRREPETILCTSAVAYGVQPEATRTRIPAPTSKQGHITVAGGEGP